MMELRYRHALLHKQEVGYVQGKQQGAEVYALLKDLNSCAMKRDIHCGRELHAKAAQNGNASNIYIATALIKMYAKCGHLVEARDVFDSIQEPNVVSWNVLLLGYAQNGKALLVLDLFLTMKAHGCVPDSVTYSAAIKACKTLAVKADFLEKRGCLERGRGIHLEIGCHLNHYLQNALIDMYASCSSMIDARRVFDSIQNPDKVSWTALILGYAETGESLVALELFSRMKACGCAVDSRAYLAAVKACTSLAVSGDGSGKEACLQRGREIHSEINGVHLDHHLQNTLIDMYAKCGSILEAHRVFNSIRVPNVVSWNVFLLGCAENGKEYLALDLFSRMKLRGCPPDSVTYAAVLKACASLALNQDASGKKDYLAQGREIHLEIGFRHLNQNVMSALIDMYARLGSMVDARCVFDRIRIPDVVSWTVLLSGYADNGEGLIALELFSRMKASGCAPDSVAYIAAFRACGLIGALDLGRKFSKEISSFTPRVVTCLVDFYAKCGSMLEACEVFDAHPGRDVATWTALLAGYSRLVDIDSVFNIFEAMQDEGIRPDAVTFVCMFLCCSHAGLVEKSREYFEVMPRYGVTPTVMHYNCMLDVLGRANQQDEAMAVVREMPCNPNAVTWNTMLSSCRKWKIVEIGRMAFQSLVAMNKKDSSAYVLMAHIYGSRGMWEEQEKILQNAEYVSSTD